MRVVEIGSEDFTVSAKLVLTKYIIVSTVSNEFDFELTDTEGTICEDESTSITG